MAVDELKMERKDKLKEELPKSLSKKLESLPALSSQPCIYKAPDHLREVNKECYQPYVISIGPLHYGCPSLKAMQDDKLRCLKLFLEHDSNVFRSDLKHYLTIVEGLKKSVHDCYAEEIRLSDDEFYQMVLVDSAFIICLFMKLDCISDMKKRSLLKWQVKLKRDLFLEENQIPFFVLERLYREAFGETDTSFLEIACNFITDGNIPVIHGTDGDIPVDDRHVIVEETIKRIMKEPDVGTMEGHKVLHLVDLLRKFCFPSNLEEAIQITNTTKVKFPSSVSNLHAAGVKFEPSKSSNLLDIKFSKGVLSIPPFELWDVSESYFRSIILFEQSHEPISKKSYLHHYIILLERLIRTPEDVQILVQRNILRNWIGSDETITRIFNGGITTHIPLPVNFCYLDECKELNAYAEKKWQWNHWKAILKRDYFSHPWATISVIYALMLLLLALLQTIGTFTK